MGRRLLISRTNTPKGVNGADWTAERAWLLLRMGDSVSARHLIQEVDAVLDKIHIHGMSSLTDEERRLLDMASREIALRDQKRRDDMKL